MGVIGRYQLEAAIQSAHAARRIAGATDWEAIVALYEGLYKITGLASCGDQSCCCLAEVRGAKAGLAALPELSANPELMEFQPYWAARAELAFTRRNIGDAAEAYGMAIGLESDPQLRNFLLGKLSKVNSRRQ